MRRAPISQTVFVREDAVFALAAERNTIAKHARQIHRSKRKSALDCHVTGAAGEIGFCDYTGARLQRDYRRDGDRHYDAVIVGQFGIEYTVEVRTRDTDYGSATTLFFRHDKPMQADLAALCVALPSSARGLIEVRLLGFVNRGSFQRHAFRADYDGLGSVLALEARSLMPISELRSGTSRLGGDPAKNWLSILDGD